MIVDTLIAIGIWSAAATAGISVTAFAVNWIRYARSEWAKSSGISFLKHCYRKNLQLKKSDRQGYVGEYNLGRQLQKVRGKKKVFHNVIIPKGGDGRTEIDAVMVHETGIYVFENKNYSGTIGCFQENKYGPRKLGNIRANADSWDVIYGKNSKRLYNPIKQNEIHIDCLKRLLGSKNISSQRFFSYVTFNDDCSVKGLPLDFSLKCNGKVLRTKNLQVDLNSRTGQVGRIFSPEKFDEICNIIDKYSHATSKEKKEHVRRLKAKEQNNVSNSTTTKTHPPLSETIRSAQSQSSSSKEKSHDAQVKNYLNMFRS